MIRIDFDHQDLGGKIDISASVHTITVKHQRTQEIRLVAIFQIVEAKGGQAIVQITSLDVPKLDNFSIMK